MAFFRFLFHNQLMEKSSSKGFGWVIGMVVVLGAAGTAVWFSQQPAPSTSPQVATPAPANPVASQTPPRSLPASSLENRPAPPTTPTPSPEPAPANPARAAAALEEIDTVLRDQSIPLDAAAQRLVRLASDATVPDQIRNDALQHAMNLLPDEAFNSVDAMIKTKATPPELLDLLFHEIHNRPVEVQLPTAFLLMKERAGEEISQQARDLLSFHLEKDLGDDPSAWSAAVQEATAKAAQATQ
ncbi:MAG: hypothetical protein DVB23_002994 [Verrucomicrobia bacterium]|nr:MAG: hypothetical protein DVB23_002994 [Verrucomicrobiota bacterium]